MPQRSAIDHLVIGVLDALAVAGSAVAIWLLYMAATSSLALEATATAVIAIGCAVAPYLLATIARRVIADKS